MHNFFYNFPFTYFQTSLFHIFFPPVSLSPSFFPFVMLIQYGFISSRLFFFFLQIFHSLLNFFPLWYFFCQSHSVLHSFHLSRQSNRYFSIVSSTQYIFLFFNFPYTYYQTPPLFIFSLANLTHSLLFICHVNYTDILALFRLLNSPFFPIFHSLITKLLLFIYFFSFCHSHFSPSHFSPPLFILRLPTVTAPPSLPAPAHTRHAREQRAGWRA